MLGGEAVTLLKKMRLLQRKRDEMDAKRVMDKTRKYLCQARPPICTQYICGHLK